MVKGLSDRGGLPTLEAWVAGLRNGVPSPWQVAWWAQSQETGFPLHWVPAGPWSEGEMCELLTLWLAHEVARGGRRQLVWATGRRGGERPFYLAAREMAGKLARAEDGAVGSVSQVLRQAAGGRDPLMVVAVGGHIGAGPSCLPPGQPGFLVMDLHDLVAGLLFRSPGVLDGQAGLVAAGLASAAAWVVVDTIVPLAAWQTLGQLRDILAAEPGATSQVQLGVISRCAGAASGSGPVAALDGVALQPVVMTPGRFASEVARLVASCPPGASEAASWPHTLVVVNDAATAVAVGAALERIRVGPVRVITGQEVRWVADRRWRELSVSPGNAAVWILAGVGDVVGLPTASRLVTEVAAWDVLAQRVGQWPGPGPVMVLGGHQAEGPGVSVWQTLLDSAGADGVVGWDVLRPSILGGLSAVQDADSALAAGWSPEGFRPAPRLTSGFLDLAVQTLPVPHPPCPLGSVVWGNGSGMAEVGVIWRAELDTEPPEKWAGLIRLLPPSGAEACRVNATALADSLRSGRWGWSPGRVGEGSASRPPMLAAGRGVICRSTGEVEVFGLPSPSGETYPVPLYAGDTIILPAGSHPSVLGPSPSAQTLMDALWAAGCPVFALGPHLPGLETFPWQRWWRLVRRRQFRQSRLARWLVALISHLDTVGETRFAARLREALDAGTPAALMPMSDGCTGWVLFPWDCVRRPGDGEVMPPGVTWRLGDLLGPRRVTSAAATAALAEAVRAWRGEDTPVGAAMELAAHGFLLGVGHDLLRQAVATFDAHLSGGMGGRRDMGSGSGAHAPEPVVVHAGTAHHPLTNGWILSREPGVPGWDGGVMSGLLAVWDHFPWEFLSVGALDAVVRSGRAGELSPEVAEMALYLVGTLRGLGRPLPGVPGSGKVAELAAVAGACVALESSAWGNGEVRLLPVTDLGDGVVERFWRMQRRFGRWGVALLEAEWRWLVWRCLRKLAGVVVRESVS